MRGLSLKTYSLFSIVVLFSALLSGCEFGFVSTEKKEDSLTTNAVHKPLAFDMVPTQLILTGPSNLSLKTCSSAFTLVTKSAKNIVSGVNADTSIALTAQVVGTFYEDSACSRAVTSLTLRAKQNSVSFYFKAERSGNSTVSVSSSGYKEGKVSVAVARVAHQLAITGPAGIIKGNCSEAFSVKVQDIEGQDFASSNAVTASLAGATIFLDDKCLNAATNNNRIIPSGSSASLFYLKVTASTPINLQAVANGLVSANLNGIGVVSANVSLSKPLNITLGQCSSVFSIRSTDVNGLDLNVTSDVIVTLSSSRAGTFYTDAGCNLAVSTGNPSVIQKGLARAEFYFKSTDPAASTRITANTSLVGSVFEDVVVVNNLDLRVEAVISSLTAGVCSPVDALLEARSGSVPTALSLPLIVALSSNGSGSFYLNDASCSTGAINSVLIPAGNNKVQGIYFRPGSAASAVLSAVPQNNIHFPAAGLTVPVLNQLGLVFSSAPAGLIEGFCSPVSFQVRTLSGGNAISTNSGLNVALSVSNSGTVSFHSDAGCSSSSMSSVNVPANGNSSSPIFVKLTSATADSLVIGAVVTGNPLITQANSPAIPVINKISIVTSVPGFILGVCSSGVFSVKSHSGAAVVAVPTTLLIDLQSGQGGFFQDANCSTPIASNRVAITANQSVSNGFYFKPTGSSWAATINASVVGTPSIPIAVFNSPVINQLVVAGSNSVTFGDCSGAITVKTKSAGVSLPAPASLGIGVVPSSGAVYSDSQCASRLTSAMISQGSDTLTFYYKAGTAFVGSASITASASALLGSNNFSISINRLALTVDSRFGSSGNSLRNMGNFGELKSMALQSSSGKYLLAGTTISGGTPNLALTRMSGAGVFDAGFGGSWSPSGFNGAKANAVLDYNGSIYVAGAAIHGTTLSDFMLVRFDANGNIASSVTVDFGFNEEEEAVDIVVLGGRLVLVGNRKTPSGNVIGFVSYDTNLSNRSALVSISAPSAGEIFARKATAFAGGISVAGKMVNGPSSDFSVTQFSPGNALFATYNSYSTLIDFGGPADEANAILEEGGALYVAGTNGARVAVAKVLNNGFIDPAFGTNGRAIGDTGAAGRTFETAYSMVVDPNGKILIGGTSDNDFLAMRFNTTGTLDTNATYRNTYNLGDSSPDEARAILVHSDGKTILAGTASLGSSSSQFAATRLFQ